MMPRGLALLPGGTDPGPLLWWMPLGAGTGAGKKAMDSPWGLLKLRYLGGPHSTENVIGQVLKADSVLLT